MFRNEKLILPSTLHVTLAATVALCAFFMNLYSPAIGYVLALVTLILIALQVWFSLRVWPTVGHSANPYFFALYWGLMSGLVIPFIIEIFIDEGITGVLDMLGE